MFVLCYLYFVETPWEYYRLGSHCVIFSILLLIPLCYIQIFFSALCSIPLLSVLNNKFYEELIAYVPLIRRGSYIKRRVQRFFYCCICIRCRGKFYAEPLPSNGRGIYIQTHRLPRGIYEVRRSDGLRCHDINTKFHKDWFSHLKVNREDNRQHKNHISLLFFQNKESRLYM
jgi:hypothetical protein